MSRALQFCLDNNLVRKLDGHTPAVHCTHLGRLHRSIPTGWLSCGCGVVRILECGYHGNLTIERPVSADARELLSKTEPRLTRCCAGCPDRAAAAIPDEPDEPTIPLRHQPHPAKWEGQSDPKPWDYQVTAAIPVIDCYDQLVVCLDLLRLQTIRPYLVLIDTGSRPSQWAKIEALRAPDCEVHQLRFNGVMHSSQVVAVAMDLAFAACPSSYLFATHQDCFLRRRDALEWFLARICGYDVAGYQLTPRDHEWQWMLGHTATMYRMASMDRAGIGWSFRRLVNTTGLRDMRHDGHHWPDTESLMNTLIRRSGLKVNLVGTEANWVRNRDATIDHVRSLPGAAIHNPSHYRKAIAWWADARREALERIAEWQAVDIS